MMGTVERVGLRTTRVRSINGELLIFANSDLTKSRVQNYKRMEKRRVNFKIGVDYSTPIEKLKLIPNLIKTSIENSGQVTFERAHFITLGDYALIYDVVYWVSSREYIQYADAQQSINLKLLEHFKQHDIEIPFPPNYNYSPSKPN